MPGFAVELKGLDERTQFRSCTDYVFRHEKVAPMARDEKATARIASLANRLMHHTDPDVRELATCVLTEAPDVPPPGSEAFPVETALEDLEREMADIRGRWPAPQSSHRGNTRADRRRPRS